MITFSTFDEAYKTILKLLVERPVSAAPRGRAIREILHFTWMLQNPMNGKLDFSTTQVPERQATYDKYLEQELTWYLSGNLRAESAPSKFWLKLADERGLITSNYGHMVLYDKKYRGQTAVEYVTAVLTDDRDSRQAVIHYGGCEHFWPGNKDVPCTMTAQVLIRHDMLHMHVTQRSVDSIKGLSYDIPWHIFVMRHLANRLSGVQLGPLVHTCGSLHLYDNDLELAQKIVNNSKKSSIIIP